MPSIPILRRSLQVAENCTHLVWWERHTYHDPLLVAPSRTCRISARSRLSFAVPAPAGRARRVPERNATQSPNLRTNARCAPRGIWSGSAAVNALFALATLASPRRDGLFLRIQSARL